MRRIALSATLLLVLTAATPAFAGGGLPKIASLQVGSNQVAVHGDSPSLHKGTNVLTVEIAELSPGQTVNLYLKGPAGQSVTVPLSDLVVLSGPAGGHGDGGHESAPTGHETTAAGHDMSAAGHDMSAAGHDMSAAGHDMSAAGHDMSAAGHDMSAAGHDMSAAGHDTAATATAYAARGKADLNATGSWHLVVEITGHDQKEAAEAHVEVVQGGPNGAYLGFTGLLMGGTFIYGVVQRRRENIGR
jgi:hypothetical protein